MKFLPVFLMSLVVVTPACVRKKKAEKQQSTAIPEKSGYVKGDKQSIFDEDVEAFVLVEESSDPFKMVATEQVDLVLFNDDKLQDVYFAERAEQRSKYGLKTIYFDFNRNDLRDDQKPALKHDLKKIKELAKEGREIVVEGHACNWAGDEPYNMMLSERRAQEVRNYLVKNGVPADKLKVVGFGFSMCVVQSGSKVEQAPNRRVEFFVK